MRIAVVDMPTRFGDVDENLRIAEIMIAKAAKEGVELIAFPEFFTTGFALNPILLQAVINSAGIENHMAKLSRQYQIAIGGSYLHYDIEKKNIYNTYGLFFKTGEQFFHSKDIPTAIENFCYTNGDEVSAFNTPFGRIGTVMCWEQLRWQTVQRMASKIDLLIGGSCWWNFTKEDGDNYYNAMFDKNRQLANQAPLHLSKILGVPFVHASHSGLFPGGTIMEPLTSCVRRIEGNAVITDAYGNQLLTSNGKPGYYIQNVTPGCILDNVDIPENKVWIPDLPPILEQGFYMLNERYREYYNNVTRKKLIE